MNSGVDDNALSRRLARDVDAAFPDVVRGHASAVYSIALRFLGDARDAEEVAQDALVRAYRALSSYDADRIATIRLRPWLATITVNACRNHYRSRARRAAHAELNGRADSGDWIEPSRGPDDRAIDGAVARSLGDALRTLPERQRAAVVLHHAAGMTYAEIADALKCAEGTVKSDVHRAIAALRGLLRDQQLEDRP